MTPCFHTVTISNVKLSIVNFCSVTNKQTQLEAFLFSNDFDILVGTESHLDDTILSSEILPNNFCTYRKDRNSIGGGAFVSVKNTILSFDVDILVGTESHLDDTILSSEILPNNFCMHRKVRNSNGGGVFSQSRTRFLPLK